MLKVNYITRPWFLDISVELIHALKAKVDLNVIIIIAPDTAGYLGLPKEEALRYLDKLIPLEEVLKGESYHRFSKYFNGVTVTCKFERHNETNFRNTFSWIRYLNINPQFLKADLTILESLSLADWYLLFKIRNQNLFYILHDPMPHTGEGRQREENVKKIYFPYINKFITYSESSAAVFAKHYAKYEDKLISLKMPVYTSQRLGNGQNSNSNKTKIVFFGRISPYKGVELFYAAADKLASKYKNIEFIIAGKTIDGYNPEFLSSNSKNNIIIKNQFLTLEDLNTIMCDAMLCVVPYIDATQSGVIMTSYAFNIPVLVSNHNGLLEYCLDKNNFSFENQNIDDLIQKLENIITHPELISSYQERILEYNIHDVSVKNSELIIRKIIK